MGSDDASVSASELELSDSALALSLLESELQETSTRLAAPTIAAAVQTRARRPRDFNAIMYATSRLIAGP